MQRITQFIAKNLILLGIVISGSLLRLWHLTSISLWHDEAFSALLIKYSWGEMIHRIGLDVHPPMYYFFLRIWSYVFGHSLFSLRGMSVLFGVGTIIVVYYFVNYTFKNRTAALIAALLVAVNPFQVQYVTEARMYTMGAFFAVVAAFALTAALRNQTEYYATVKNLVLRAQLKKKFFLQFVIFILASTVLSYTHYYLLFTVAALGFYGIGYCIIKYKLQFKKWLGVILSGLAVAVLFIPWLKIFIFQFKQVGAGYWIPPMDRWSIPGTLWELLIRLPTSSSTHSMWIFITLVALVATIIYLRKTIMPEKWLVLLGFLAPFGGAILFLILAKLQGNSSSVYLVRYFIFSSSFYLIILAVFFSQMRIRQIGKAFIVLLVILNIYSVWNYWDVLQVRTKPGMAAASKFLTANVEPTHKVYIGSNFEFFNYKYYNGTQVKPLLFSNGQFTKDMPHFAGTAILTDDDLVQNFAESTRTGDTVWLLWTNGFGGTKPNTPPNWVQVDEKGFAEVRPYVGTWVIVSQFKVN